MVFQCINIRLIPWEVLKTAASGLSFQHLPWDLANVNAWKTVFDPYIVAFPGSLHLYYHMKKNKDWLYCLETLDFGLK